MILGTQGTVTETVPDTIVGRVTSASVEMAVRGDHILLCRTGTQSDTSGYAAALSTEPFPQGVAIPYVHVTSLDHLSDGDVVSVDPRGYVRTLYRRHSPHNFILATDRCNSLCLMCSQPPKEVDETGIVNRHLRLIRLIDPATRELGITGGEPTLLGDGLVRMLTECRDRLPETAIHVLSNGRLFSNDLADRVAAVRHPDLMFGIPLYSDLDEEHDYIVQSHGAFAETLRGLQNLARVEVSVEIRVVVHRQTYSRLPELAEFLYRNVTFAAQVVFMGLEITGFTIPNLSSVWIDPWDYRSELRDAVLFLASRGVSVWIYNHQLCILPRELWRFARQSISDWKNEYLPKCNGCLVKNDCGGFFSSTVNRKRESQYIVPVLATEHQQYANLRDPSG